MQFAIFNPDALQAVLAGTANHLVPAFTAIARAAASQAATALWQGAAIALALSLCLRLAPRVPATHRFAAWTAGFATVVCLPLIPFLVHSTASGVPAAFSLPVHAPTPWLALDSRWALAIAALWIALSAARAISLVMQSLHLRRLWNSASPIAKTDPAAQFSAHLPMRRCVEICTTKALERPGVIGFLAPRILIPEWLYTRLSPAELEHTILHEAEHLRRHDDWTNLLQKFCMTLFPLNPALAWMEQRLAREREMACDEAVVRRTHTPRAYAACLTNLAEQSLERRNLPRRAEALSLGAFERRSELVRRVHSILWNRQSLHPLIARALVTLVGLGLLALSATLAKCPQMIAFVSAPQSPEQVPAKTNPQIIPAINTLAAVKSKTAQLHSARPKSGGQASPAAFAALHNSERSAGNSAPREVAFNEADGNEAYETRVKAVAPTNINSVAQERQIVVLTAWKEVRTTPDDSRILADSGNRTTGSAQPLSSRTMNQAVKHPPVQIIITRWVLEVHPPASASTPASGSQQVQGSKSNQPVSLPFDPGWLIFQL